VKIAILGTRGIPNYHGGFEQFAEFFSVFMNKKGNEVYVYNSHSHPYQKVQYEGVHIIHKYDPENNIGTAGQFIYDLNCILDCRRQDFDVILQLGYTSSSIWGWLLPKKSLVVTNMDGLEWKRSKYSKVVRKFLKYAEKLAVKTSDYLISDSLGIQSYIKQKYNKESKYIAYGADLFSSESAAVLSEYNVTKYNYNLLIARLEPENNIEMILDGVSMSKNKKTFLVIGKHETKFGNYLKNKYKSYENIQFLGGIYNLDHLNNLRFWSNLYFHGHSVGGTNPSLLEAMASNCLIIANDNIFNKSILENNAFYFSDVEDVIKRLKLNKKVHVDLVENNCLKIKKEFEWGIINKKYSTFIHEIFKNSE
jgi:glycosyltransferase involved in cell wall biosynthesis